MKKAKPDSSLTFLIIFLTKQNYLYLNPFYQNVKMHIKINGVPVMFMV